MLAFVLLAVLPATHAAEPNFILKFLTPSATLGPSPNYDGYQLKYGNVVFRPAEFISEGIVLTAIFTYVLWYFVGKSLNSSRAHAWYNAHYPLLESQFSQPGTEAGLISDGASDYFNFSTGRRSVLTLHSVFALQPRHDLLQLLYHFARGMMELDYRTTDELQLDFKLPPVASTNKDGFVWALVSKAEMKVLRKERWDLSFTKTSENSALPADVTVMSEFADVTETILKSPAAAEIIKLLNNPSIAPYFRSLIITDQPKERPEAPLPTTRRQRHLYLNLSVPPPSKSSSTVPLVKAVFGIADLLDSSKFGLRPETTKKLRKVREDLDEELAKEAAKEQKDQAEQEKQAAKRKAEEERMSRLSAAEQKKLEEKERKRALRKQQGKMVKKK